MPDIVRRQLERNWIFLAVAALMLGGFEFLLCAVVDQTRDAQTCLMECRAASFGLERSGIARLG